MQIMDPSAIQGSTTIVDSDTGGKDHHFGLSGQEHEGDIFAAVTQSLYTTSVGEVNVVPPSTELPGESGMHVKFGGSPPHRVDETVNCTSLGMGTDEVLGTSLLRQVVRTVDDCPSDGLQ